MLIITSVVLWSYYAYVFELCFCKYDNLCTFFWLVDDLNAKIADCGTTVLTNKTLLARQSEVLKSLELR